MVPPLHRKKPAGSTRRCSVTLAIKMAGFLSMRSARMEAALDEAGITNEIYVYENAQHAFFNDTRAGSYSPEASAEAWERTLAWFAEYLQS